MQTLAELLAAWRAERSGVVLDGCFTPERLYASYADFCRQHDAQAASWEAMKSIMTAEYYQQAAFFTHLYRFLPMLDCDPIVSENTMTVGTTELVK